MREQLIQYVRLLFVGTEDTDDIQQEILQNTLDKYDDLIDHGKSPEAAYRLAISGIGDINEILGTPPAPLSPSPEPKKTAKKRNNKLLCSIAIALYILCPIPLLAIGNEIGLCLLLAMAAAATALLVLCDKEEKNAAHATEMDGSSNAAKKKLHKAVGTIVWLLGTFGYFALSFATGAWWITWLVFPMLGAINGLINAIIDLNEVCRNEG